MPFRFISKKSRSFTLFTLIWGISRDGLNIACTAFFKPGKFMAWRKEYLDRLIESVKSARTREKTSTVRNLLVKRETINFLVAWNGEVLSQCDVNERKVIAGKFNLCSSDFASNFGTVGKTVNSKNTQNPKIPDFLGLEFLKILMIYLESYLPSRPFMVPGLMRFRKNNSAFFMWLFCSSGPFF